MPLIKECLASALIDPKKIGCAISDAHPPQHMSISIAVPFSSIWHPGYGVGALVVI